MNDQELVKPLPLTFGGEKNRLSNATEQPNKATRSVWLYVDQSETDDDADAGTCDDILYNHFYDYDYSNSFFYI